MKLSELIQLEKDLRELVFFAPGPNNCYDLYAKQNKAAKSLGVIVYEIEKLSREIKVEIKNDTVQA